VCIDIFTNAGQKCRENLCYFRNVLINICLHNTCIWFLADLICLDRIILILDLCLSVCISACLPVCHCLVCCCLCDKYLHIIINLADLICLDRIILILDLAFHHSTLLSANSVEAVSTLLCYSQP